MEDIDEFTVCYWRLIDLKISMAESVIFVNDAIRYNDYHNWIMSVPRQHFSYFEDHEGAFILFYDNFMLDTK